MLALVVDTSAHLRAMCYKCYNESIPPHTRLALNEFQASCYSHHCYSHHKSQSALSETNWLLRVSGCNLTLNPYQTIQMGHHHRHPLTRAMELRPDHWSTTLKPHLETPRDYVPTYTDSQEINTYIMHRNFILTSITNTHLSHVEPVPTRYYQPWEKCLLPYHYHATGLPILNVHCCSCQICDHIYIQPLMYNSHKDHAKLTIYHM